VRDLIVDEINRCGPISFARFMELALYHPQHGYYASGRPRAGWGGDFVTAPELDPAFGELWARALQDVWRACGSPARFDVVEIGGGEGGWAAALLSSAPPELRSALRLRLVEPVARLRGRQALRLRGLGQVAWSGRIDEVDPLRCGCVFANEVVDNQPVHLVEGRAGEVVELLVTAANGDLGLEPHPPSPELRAWLERWGLRPAEGARVEAALAAEHLVGAAARLLRRGIVVFVDYGGETTELAARPAGTVAAYSAGEADARVLEAPGGRDITAHVNWTLVRRWLEAAGLQARGPLSQRAVLRALGAGDLAERFATEARSGRGANVVRALSRGQALAALLDPGGLGGLDVMVGLAGIECPAFMSTAC
jgi:SAM-dependent MidA family methyltransferase